MSKIICLTKEKREELLREFCGTLDSARLVDGKLTFSKEFGSSNERATVYFTPIAWSKMVVLLDALDKEVAWHGFAERMDEERNEYLISDIVVYPQRVTGSTVEMDEAEYARWITDHIWDDERYLRFGMQGHSHVRMGVTPSTTDLQHQQKIVDRLEEDGFYIFMIYNKYFAKTVRVFDMKKNILFENKDVDVKLYDADESLDEFLSDSLAMVRDYYGAPKTSYGTPAKAAAPLAGVTQPASAAKKTETPKAQIGAGWGGKKTDPYDDDDPTYYDGYYGGYEGCRWDATRGCWVPDEDEDVIDSFGVTRYIPKYRS